MYLLHHTRRPQATNQYSLFIYTLLNGLKNVCLFFQEFYVPGILYYACGVYALLCIVSCYFLPETKDLDLNDNLEVSVGKVKPAECSNHI